MVKVLSSGSGDRRSSCGVWAALSHGKLPVETDDGERVLGLDTRGLIAEVARSSI